MMHSIADAFMVAMSFLSGHVPTQVTALFVALAGGIIYLTHAFASEWGKASLGIMCGLAVVLAWRLGSALALISGGLFGLAIVWPPAIWTQVIIVTLWATWLCEPSRLKMFLRR